MFHRLPLDPPSLGDKLFARAQVVKIELLRLTDSEDDRNVFASYTIEGNLRIEEEEGVDRRLLLELIRQFAQPLPKIGGGQ